MPLRVIFMGTPDFAAESLRKIFDAGHDIAAVYTQPPRPGGRRGLELIKTPVQLEAERLGLEVRTPVSMKNPVEQDGFAELKADVAVVVAYGLLLPKPVLEATRFGAFNGHASALPRWRGAAPIQRAILAGDRQTAVMIMKMDEGLDTGPVALERSITIGENETFGDLQDRMAAISAELMVKALSGLEAGTLKLKPQAEDGATYARKIDKAETRIDWSRPARDIHNFIRGLSPVPGAWCEMETKGRIERVKVLRSLMADGSGTAGELLDERLRIATGSGALRLTRLQKAGGKAVDAEDFLRGSPVSKVS